MKKIIAALVISVSFAGAAYAVPVEYGVSIPSLVPYLVGRGVTKEELIDYASQSEEGAFFQVFHVPSYAHRYFGNSDDIMNGLDLALSPALPGFESLLDRFTAVGNRGGDPQYGDDYGAVWSMAPARVNHPGWNFAPKGPTFKGSQVLAYLVTTRIGKDGAVHRDVELITDEKSAAAWDDRASSFEREFAAFLRGKGAERAEHAARVQKELQDSLDHEFQPE